MSHCQTASSEEQEAIHHNARQTMSNAAGMTQLTSTAFIQQQTVSRLNAGMA
jgi:hypothetical protein